jgi:hypothetical protein
MNIDDCNKDCNRLSICLSINHSHGPCGDPDTGYRALSKSTVTSMFFFMHLFAHGAIMSPSVLSVKTSSFQDANAVCAHVKNLR